MRVEGEPAELAVLRKALPGSKVAEGSLSASKEAADPVETIEQLHRLGDATRGAEKNSERL